MVAYLTTAYVAILLLRRKPHRWLRVLAVVLAVMPLAKALGLLSTSGIAPPVGAHIIETTDVFVSTLCLVGVYVLRQEIRERRQADTHLRVIEGTAICAKPFIGSN